MQERRCTLAHGLGGILAGFTLLATLVANGGCGGLGWRGVEAERSAADRELSEYKRAHFTALGNRIVGYRTHEEVLRRIERSEVLWLGDRHDATATHAAQLELLRELHARGRRLILALEAIGLDDEPGVQHFLRGAGGLRELRARLLTQPGGSWLDSSELDSAFYRDLLTFAKEAGASVRALERIPRPPLARRDAEMATRVREIHRERGDALLVVIVGHVHLLGEGHLIDAAGLVGVALLPDGGPGLAPTLQSTPPDRRRDFPEVAEDVLLWPRE